MTTKSAQSLITACIHARLPILIVGAPGVGKTDIVSSAAAGMELLISHPVVADPTDAKGLPVPAGDHATFLPFGDLARALTTKKPLVWFLDDLGQASPAVQASYMQLLLGRRVNGHALPQEVTFVAASNRRTDRAGVSGMLEPVKSRFATIIEIEANVDDWSEWALANNLPVTLVAFIRYRPDLLCQFSPTADLTNSPVPRTWHKLAQLEALRLPKHIEQQAFAGAVGEGAATEYLSFRSIASALVTADQILLDPKKAPLPVKPAECYAVVTALASKVNAANFAGAAQYAERLLRAAKGEFAALMLRDISRRNEAITTCEDWIHTVSGPLGTLIQSCK